MRHRTLTKVSTQRGFQSTHPRGVRRNPQLWKSEIDKFQSTHPRGVRPRTDNIKVDTAKFQSTHPRGVRPIQKPLCVHLPNFNPRTHVGCDNEAAEVLRRCTISIHAPTWGATESSPRRWQDSPISIHAPTWGATIGALSLPQQTEFQSTHPRGVRPPLTPVTAQHLQISIHAPTWGATSGGFKKIL